MADFFTRVAERTLGLTPAVKPDLPSVFTPAAPVEITQETISPQLKAATPHVSTEDPAPRRPNEESAFQSIASRRHNPASLQFTHEPGVVESRSSTPESTAPSVPAKVLSRDLPFSLEQREPESAAAEDSPAFETIQQAIATRPATSAASNMKTIVDNSHAPAPTIQVTIGRVEVRANMTPPPARKTPEKKQSPHLSLDQYLRERNGGRR